MSAFLTPLTVRYIGNKDEDLWELTEDFIYQSDVAGMTFLIPKGFRTDFSSVPRIPLAYWLTGGKAKLASIPHDYICETGIVSRELGDLVFLEASELQGVPAWRRKLMYAAVRSYAVVTGKDSDNKNNLDEDIYKF